MPRVPIHTHDDLNTGGRLRTSAFAYGATGGGAHAHPYEAEGAVAAHNSGTAVHGVIIQEVDGSPAGTVTSLVVTNGALSVSGGTATINVSGTVTADIVVNDEGSTIGTATVLNFTGAGGTASFSNGTATVTIPGLIVQDEGSVAGTATILNVVGAGGTVAYAGGTATLTIAAGSSGIVFLDEGNAAGTATVVNVTGAGGTVSVSGGTATLNITASAGSASRHDPGVPTGDLLREYTFDSTVEDWTTDAGSLTAVSGSARLSHTTNAVALEPAGAADQADGEVEALLTIAGGNEASVVFRATDASNYYLFAVLNGAGNSVLYKVVGGTFTALRTGEVAQLTGAVSLVVMVRFIGSLIQCYINGRHMMSVVDATYTTGRIGMRVFNDTVDLDTIRLYENAALLGDNV